VYSYLPSSIRLSRLSANGPRAPYRASPRRPPPLP
jgi:hypothetical protein